MFATIIDGLRDEPQLLFYTSNARHHCSLTTCPYLINEKNSVGEVNQQLLKERVVQTWKVWA